MLKLLKYELIHEWRSYGIIYLVFIGRLRSVADLI